MANEFPRRPEPKRRDPKDRVKPRAAEPATPPGRSPVRPPSRPPARRAEHPPERAGGFAPRGEVVQHGGGKPQRAAAGTAWEAQATWYDRHQGGTGDDFYQQAILPAVWRRLNVKPGQRVLDIGCGQGVVGRHLAEQQVASVGIDASPSLIDAASRRAGPLEQYRVGDVTALAGAVARERFDGATAVLAVQDMEPLLPVFTGVAAALQPGARFVIVLTHPCFRIPKHSGWGFDDDTGVQYRRIETYLSAQRLPIITHPGRPDDGSRTWSFHRPISAYLNTLGASGFGVIACDELCSHRRGSQGRKSAAEDTAAREIPLFLVLVGRRL